MKTRKSTKGIALFEVLIAAIILAVGVFSLIAFHADLVRERSLISQEEVALNLAQDKLEYFRNYTALTATTGQLAYADIISGSSSETSTGTTFTVTWTVTDLIKPVRKNVDITISWTDSANTAHVVTLSTIIARVDLNASGKVAQGLPL